MQNKLELVVKIVAVLSVAVASRHWYVVKYEGFALRDVPRKVYGFVLVTLATIAVAWLPFFVSPILIGVTLVWFIDFKTRGRPLLVWIRRW